MPKFGPLEDDSDDSVYFSADDIQTPAGVDVFSTATTGPTETVVSPTPALPPPEPAPAIAATEPVSVVVVNTAASAAPVNEIKAEVVPEPEVAPKGTGTGTFFDEVLVLFVDVIAPNKRISTPAFCAGMQRLLDVLGMRLRARVPLCPAPQRLASHRDVGW